MHLPEYLKKLMSAPFHRSNLLASAHASVNSADPVIYERLRFKLLDDMHNAGGDHRRLEDIVLELQLLDLRAASVFCTRQQSHRLFLQLWTYLNDGDTREEAVFSKGRIRYLAAMMGIQHGFIRLNDVDIEALRMPALTVGLDPALFLAGLLDCYMHRNGENLELLEKAAQRAGLLPCSGFEQGLFRLIDDLIKDQANQESVRNCLSSISNYHEWQLFHTGIWQECLDLGIVDQDAWHLHLAVGARLIDQE